MQEKVHGPHIHIGEDTAMVIRAPNIEITSLHLKHGALVIEGTVNDSKITISDLTVDNKGWEWVALDDSTRSSAPEVNQIRYVILFSNVCLDRSPHQCIQPCCLYVPSICICTGALS